MRPTTSASSALSVTSGTSAPQEVAERQAAYADADTAGIGVAEGNALRSAESYLRYSEFSKVGLYEQLLYEGYTESESQYGVHNVSADWNQQALGTAESYLTYSGFSTGGLAEQLAYEEFTPEQITYAMNNVSADWNAEAAEKAASYMEYSAFSASGLYDQLTFEEVTPEQAQHGVTSVGL